MRSTTQQRFLLTKPLYAVRSPLLKRHHFQQHAFLSANKFVYITYFSDELYERAFSVKMLLPYGSFRPKKSLVSFRELILAGVKSGDIGQVSVKERHYPSLISLFKSYMYIPVRGGLLARTRKRVFVTNRLQYVKILVRRRFG